MANPNVSAGFIVGDWYEVTSGKFKIAPNDHWYMEYHSTDDMIRASRYIHNHKLTTSYHNWGHLDSYTFRRIPKSKIQHLLPVEERELIINNYEIY